MRAPDTVLLGAGSSVLSGYHQCTAVGMQAFREVMDVSLVVRHPRKPREEVPQHAPDVQAISWSAGTYPPPAMNLLVSHEPEHASAWLNLPGNQNLGEHCDALVVLL